MYTEIVKIIEGGLKNEPQKVVQYARRLAEIFEADGNKQFAKGIKAVIANKGISTLSMEQLITTAPVDTETRMSIIDLFIPTEDEGNIVLSESIERKVNEFIKIIDNKDKIKLHGVSLQSTILLYGKPGVGKNTIAKYISWKTKLPLVITRLDALISSLLGNTSKNIRRVFEYADSKPCILFLDEFDAIAKARDDQHEIGELKRVINSLLQNIDLFAQNNILIAATNHPELLDRAIWRRFNTVIEVENLNTKGVEKLLSLYLRGFEKDFINDKKYYDKVINTLSKKSPADIKTIINNTITQAIIKDKLTVLSEDILLETFYFDNHGNYSQEDLIKYLNEIGIPKLQIANTLNISIRQIRNNLK